MNDKTQRFQKNKTALYSSLSNGSRPKPLVLLLKKKKKNVSLVFMTLAVNLSFSQNQYQI